MEAAEKLSVTVTAALAKLIRDKVDDGSYGSASEVVRAALRALQREDEEHEYRLALIKARIKASTDDLGPGYSNEEVFGEIRKRLTAGNETGLHEPPARPLE